MVPRRWLAHTSVPVLTQPIAVGPTWSFTGPHVWAMRSVEILALVSPLTRRTPAGCRSPAGGAMLTVAERWPGTLCAGVRGWWVLERGRAAEARARAELVPPKFCATRLRQRGRGWWGLPSVGDQAAAATLPEGAHLSRPRLPRTLPCRRDARLRCRGALHPAAANVASYSRLQKTRGKTGAKGAWKKSCMAKQ